MNWANKILLAIVALNFSINCMDNQKENTRTVSQAIFKDEKVLAIIKENRNRIKSINQNLQSHGLIPELCKMITEYDDYRFYYQFDSTNDGHALDVKALVYCEDSKILASASFDRTIKLWDLNKDSDKYLKCIATLNDPTGIFHALAYCIDRKILASGNSGGIIKLWSLDKDNKETYLKAIDSFDSHVDDVYALEYCSDRKILASGGYRIINLWDLDKDNKATFNKRIAIFDLGRHAGEVYALTYCSDRKILASGGRDGSVNLWDLDKDNKTYLTCIATFETTNDMVRGRYTGIVYALAFCADSKILASGTDHNKRIELWSLDEDSDKYRSCIAAFNKTNGDYAAWVYSFAYCAKNKILVSGSGRTIKLWNLDKESKETYLQCIATLSGHTTNVYALAFCEGSKILASGSGCGDRTIKLWTNYCLDYPKEIESQLAKLESESAVI